MQSLDTDVTARPLDLLQVDLGPGVRAGFTTRAGGVSGGPWAGLDLALHAGDDPAAVHANRELLAAWAGAPVRFPRQVHGTTVLRLGPASAAPQGGDDAEADGLVTTEPGLPVGVLVADCMPVLLADAGAGVVAAVHAGRRGLLGGVLTGAVGAMVAAGAEPARIRAAIGPAVGGCCYEVPAQLQAQACADRPELYGTTTWGTPSLDLPAGAVGELTALGVASVAVAGRCTVEDESFYSYRRAAVTGRFAGVVTLRP